MVSDWSQYLTSTLLSHQIITDGPSFAELIKQHMDSQGFVLEPYPIAIPHLKNDIIKKPFILITILNEPIVLKSNQNGKDRAQLALDVFASRIHKYIGSYATRMHGVDVIVFTAGVGEN
ncbi:PTS sugar transporter subunit IIA, partial [Staphylococcus aureus]